MAEDRAIVNNTTEEGEEDKKWETSKSKAVLREGILFGMILPHMKPREVRALNPEVHQKWAYANWTNNLRNLRAAIDRDRSRMQKDAEAYGHDRAIAMAKRPEPSDGQPLPWHKSDARKLIKIDVAAKKHVGIKPREFRMTRSEYQLFDNNEFRQHLYQEIYSEGKREWRFQKKKAKWKYPELHKDHPRLKKPPANT